jgi:hypothetical protein
MPPSPTKETDVNNLRLAVSTAILVLALAAPAVGQEPTTSLVSVLATGQRVRVRSTTEPRAVIGGVSAVDIESLTLIPDGLPPLEIPARSITSVETSQGHKRSWQRGLLVGLAFGVGLGFAFSVDAENCGPETPHFCSRGEALAASTIIFSGVGAAVGAFIKSERWTPLDVKRPTP